MTDKVEAYKVELTTDITPRHAEIIEELSAKYPETVAGFKDYLATEFTTFCKKQYDYGPGNISVGTQLKDEKEIMISLKGLWFRMNDKLQRLFNIIMVRDSLEAQNESVEDAWMDLAVYGKICQLVKSGKWGK